jgi:DNA-binding IscR family transcriptional regulator
MAPSEISVAKVMQAVEGKLTLPEKARSVTAGLAVAVLEKAAEEIKASLEKITLEDACGGCTPLPAEHSDSEASQEAPAEVKHERKTSSLGRQRCLKPRAASRNSGKK